MRNRLLTGIGIAAVLIVSLTACWGSGSPGATPPTVFTPSVSVPSATPSTTTFTLGASIAAPTP